MTAWSHVVFLAGFLGGTAGVLLSVWIFLDEMVGGGDGVVGPKELMGWVDETTDDLDYTPPHHFPLVEAIPK